MDGVYPNFPEVGSTKWGASPDALTDGHKSSGAQVNLPCTVL